MDFFGIGSPELFLILVVALIVFGPDKLPEIVRNVGKTIREFRRASDEMRDTVLKEVDLEGMRKTAQSVKEEVKSSLSLVPTEVGTAKPPSESAGALSSPDPAQGEAPSSSTQGEEKP